ncbi:MAG: hypothetical protein IT440_02225 [Phycisphaeraceae bacterium]|nr:hypothetical protein [Phycisphaeraceae bacterium]
MTPGTLLPNRCRINRLSPLAAGLVRAYVAAPSVGTARDLAGGDLALSGSGAARPIQAFDPGCGPVFQYDGADDRLQGSVVPETNGSVSVAMWIQPRALPTAGNFAVPASWYDYYVTDAEYSTGLVVQLFNNAGTHQLYAGIGFGSSATVNYSSLGFFTNWTLSILQPSLVCCVYNHVDRTLRLSINSTEIGASTWSGTGDPRYVSGSKALNIGQFGFMTYASSELVRAFDGWIGSVLIWNRAISGTEVQRLHDPSTRWSWLATRRTPCAKFISVPPSSGGGGGAFGVLGSSLIRGWAVAG